jgi:hypothetical protein
VRQIALVALAAALFASCRGGDDADGANGARAGGGPARPAYREQMVENGGRIWGTIALGADSASISAASAGETCDIFPRRARTPREPEARAVVWLANIRAGKPISAVKRFTITTEACDLEPRVQAVVAGGTLNVLNTDAIEHSTRFVDGANTTLAVIEQFDAGQLVPRSDLIVAPGVLEVRCDRHPWSRAWIHVFDHPYFAEVRSNGSFAFDSVPPGDYRLMVWEESSGTRERRVSVHAGENAHIEVGPER